MSWLTFWLIVLVLGGSILAFRVVPLFALSNKELPEGVEKALSFVPVAAFAALVANDLIQPEAFTNFTLVDLVPFISSILVALIAYKTKSLAACILVGVASYTLLTHIM